MNLYQRHGARVKIAHDADFNGTRWTTNALIHQMPAGMSYLLPAGAVARLFKRHNGNARRLRKVISGQSRRRCQPLRRQILPPRREHELLRLGRSHFRRERHDRDWQSHS